MQELCWKLNEADQHRRVKLLSRTGLVRLGRGSGIVLGVLQVFGGFRVSTFLGDTTQVPELSGKLVKFQTRGGLAYEKLMGRNI